MDPENFIFRTWFEDDEGNKHHLYVEHFLGAGNDVFYHCTIDGKTKIDVEMVDNGWEDVSKKDGRFAKELGAIIEHHCK